MPGVVGECGAGVGLYVYLFGVGAGVGLYVYGFGGLGASALQLFFPLPFPHPPPDLCRSTTKISSARAFPRRNTTNNQRFIVAAKNIETGLLVSSPFAAKVR